MVMQSQHKCSFVNFFRFFFSEKHSILCYKIFATESGCNTIAEEINDP